MLRFQISNVLFAVNTEHLIVLSKFILKLEFHVTVSGLAKQYDFYLRNFIKNTLYRW